MNEITTRAKASQSLAESRAVAVKRPLRVLHVISGLGVGGAETVLFRLATQAHGLEHEIICLGPPEWYSDRLAERGIKVHHVNLSSVTGLGPGLFRLARLARSSGADVIQGWMYRGNVIGGILGRFARKPVVWNIRCSDFDLLPLRTRALAYVGGVLARWVPDLIVNCSSTSQELHARIGYDAAPVALIPNGYDPQSFYPDDEDSRATRASFGLDPDAFLIGCIGRWDPQKGYPVLIRALALLRERGVPVRALLVGRGIDDSNPRLAELLNEQGGTDYIKVVGHQTDVARVARAFDVHVLPSMTEGFPNVVAETMLSGVPNVTTNVGDAAHIVGDTGWVIPPGSTEQMADGIETAYAEWKSSPAEWRRRRETARRRVVEHFSLDAMVDAYENAWGEVAAPGPAALNVVANPASDGAASGQRRLRVLHVINSLGLGGAETILYRLINYGNATDHVVVSLEEPGWYSERLEEAGVEVHHLGIRSYWDAVAAMPNLRTIIRQSGADVVQCWLYRSNVYGGLIARAAGKPVIWGIHCSDPSSLKSSSRALARLGGAVAGWNPTTMINCSERSAQVHEQFGYGRGTVAVVPNGYDARIFYPDEVARRRTRQELGLFDADFAVGIIARWDTLKDIPNFLNAARAVHDRGVKARFFLIGSGLTVTNRALREQIELAGCADVVVPLGPRADIENVSRAIDLHVLSSKTEACPNVVAETMLSGTPNVATDVGDTAKMIGGAGWVVPPRDSAALAGGIIAAHEEWSRSPEQWEKRRSAARDQIASHYSVEAMVDAYVRVWNTAARRSQADLKPTAVQ